MRKSGEGRSKILTVKMMKTKMVWPGKSRLKRTLNKNTLLSLFFFLEKSKLEKNKKKTKKQEKKTNKQTNSFTL